MEPQRNRADAPDVRLGMLSRRELLRAGTLGGLVVAAPGLFAGCSDDDSPPPNGAVRRDPPGLVRRGADRRRPRGDRHRVPPPCSPSARGLYGQLVGDARQPRPLAVLRRGGARHDRQRRRRSPPATRCSRSWPPTDTDVPRRRAQRAHGVRRVAGRPGPGREGRRDRARLGQPAVRPGRLAVGAAVPRRAGPQLRRRASARSTTRRRHRAGAHRDQRLDRRADPRPDPRDHPGRRARRRTTRLVLVNALYFKAPWLEPFEVGRHHRRRLPPRRRRRRCPCRRCTAARGYSEGDGWRAAHLALRRQHPRDDRGAARRGPRGRPRRRWSAAAGSPQLLEPQAGEVDLSLPRWRFLVGAPLKDALDRRSGMTHGLRRPGRPTSPAMTTEDAALRQRRAAAGVHRRRRGRHRGGRRDRGGHGGDQRAGRTRRSRWSSTGRSSS